MSHHCELLSGNRQHFQHGPIDLLIQAEGDPIAVQDAHAQASKQFAEVLPTLVTELSRLRQPLRTGNPNAFIGPVARRMWQACRPFADEFFITPMAAVAGSVAQHILKSYQVPGIKRAWVNNGGDIALHLTPGTQLQLGLFSDLTRVLPSILTAQLPELDAMATILAESNIGGVATSGWAGRSHSFGIADSVTVFASDAGVADAAATILANAVNVDDDLVVRQPASSLSDDTDLEDRLVTVSVPKLDRSQVARALAYGLEKAQTYVDAGLLQSVVLMCQGQVVSATRLKAPIKERVLCHQ
jgi:ApbE superfamily uncharacterized protein (UPF0280 family)